MGSLPQEIQLRADPAELSVMRDFVTAWAERSHLADEDKFSACLVATEAVTNAMRHGCAADMRECPIRVTCTLEAGELVVEVTDRGRFRSEPDRERQDDNGGRGLFLIRELTRSFDLSAGAEGTHLCMRLPAHERELAGTQAA